MIWQQERTADGAQANKR